MKYLKTFTVKEWKKMCKSIHSAENIGNQIQFINFFTKEKESYDYLTTAEVILHRYKVILLDHHNRHSNKLITIPLKEKLKDGLKSLPSKINQKNFDKGMKVFDESMQGLTKSLDQLGDGLGGKKDNKSKMEKLWGKSEKNHDFITGGKKSNLDKIWGSPSKRKSSSVKIWSDPVQPKRKRKAKRKSKSQSEKWDNREAIWGKSKKFKL